MDQSQSYIFNEETNLNEVLNNLNDVYARDRVIKELQRRALFQHYFDEFQILSEKEAEKIEDLFQKFCLSRKLLNSNDIANFLRVTGQTKESIIEAILYEDRVSRLKKMVVNANSINDLFLERKLRFDSVTFSLIRVERESLACELYYRLKDDRVDFGILAKEYSTGTEANQGGIVGPMSLQGLNPEIRSRLLTLQEGEITEPFTVDDKTFLITKLIRFDRITLNPQLEEGLRNELFESWVERQLNLARQ